MPPVAGQPATVFYLLNTSPHERAFNQIVLDPATGETVKSYRQLLGFDTVPLGDVLVGAGPDVVARLVDP